MGCTTSCIAPSIAELNKSVKRGDERALLHQLAAYPKLLSSCTSLLSSTAITPFHVACENKQLKVVQQVISFLSCSTIDIVREALLPYCRRTGAQLPDTVTDGVRLAVGMTNAKGQTPLMYACFADCPEVVKVLLANGADPWAGDRCGGRTALHYAAMGGSAACIQALMKHIPPRLITHQGNRYVNARSLCGLTPLHYCVYFGHLEAIRELLHHDPNITAATTSESYDVSATCDVSSSPLHFAAVKGNAAAARELLQYYAQRLASGTRLADPRTRPDATSQLPWQVAFAYHPANLELAALLHPGQPIAMALGRGASAAASSEVGPAPLAVIAAVALREKLLADLRRVQEPAAAAAGTTTTTHTTTGKTNVNIGAEIVVTPRVAPTAAAGTVEPTSAPRSSEDLSPLEDCAAAASASAAQAGSCVVAAYIAKQHSRGVECAAATACEGGGGCGCVAGAAGAAADAPFAGCSCGMRPGAYGSVPGTVCVGTSQAAVAVAAAAAADDDDDGLCGLCFAAREAVAPVGCGHGICAGCARKLCRGMTRKPLQCPFCRRVVTGLVAHGSAGAQGMASAAGAQGMAAVAGAQGMAAAAAVTAATVLMQ